MIRASGQRIIVRRTSRMHTLLTSMVTILTIGVFIASVSQFLTKTSQVSAATSTNLNFQARLSNVNGSSVSDGNYSIEFKIYAVATGGTAEWSETQASVRTVNGYLTVSLGSTTPFPSTIDWSQEHWLTMNVGGDGEMLGAGGTRLKLTAVPYAFRAGQADTLTSGSASLAAGDLIQKTPISPQSFSSLLAAIRLDQTGAGGLLQLQGNGSDVFTVSKTGAVTAGTYNTNTFTGTALTFGGTGATTVQAATNQGLTVQSQGTGVLTLTSGSGTVVLGSNTLQNTSAAMTLDVNNVGLSTFSIVNNNGSNLVNLDVEGGLFVGNANAFSVNGDGDITSVFTTLNGSSTTNGAAVVASTSMILTDASNFDVGNYIKLDNNGAGCSGSVTICYAKITAKATNVLTITPALTWSTGRTVTEMHIPEVGGLDTSQPLENRYGRGYFIAGVATGNGTTYYNENGIETSLTSFDLLNAGVTTLNIGGEATTINLGSPGTTLMLPGIVDIAGASLDIGTATQQGSLILQNGSAKTGTIQVGTLAANRTYTLPDVDGTICLTTTCTGGGGPGDAFVKDGNTFGVLSVLGTNDVFGLALETSGLQRVLIAAGGNVGIGTSGAPSQLLSIGGTTGNLTVSSAGSLVAADITSGGALSVLAGGASINGGLNNNSGGITNTGSITGVGTNITANAGLTIASGGTSDLTLSSASGLLALTVGTIQTVDNLAFDLAKATDTTLTLQNSGTGIVNLNLLDGGLSTGGTLRVSNTGALQNITGLTVISGGASITGNITLGGSSSDRLTLTGQLGGASPLVFQGATDDGFATTLGIQDPTANNTITLPNASGTLVLDSRSITTAAGSGLSGGGDLSVDRSLSLDINGITTTTAIANDDYVAIYDSSATGIRKISRSDFLQGVIGALIYQGTWDASTNTPTLSDATGTNGYMYAVSVAGSENFGSGPSITFGVGDFVIHNGTDWEKAPSSANVTSVFGRTGAVTAQSGDYSGLQITNTPSGTIAATTVQAAINELATEKLGSLNGLTAITQTFVNDTNITVTSSGSTHTFGWAGQLSVARGGTGTNTFTTNGVLYGNGTSALQVSAAGTGGQVLLANASGVPTFTSFSGDVTVSSTGVTTIGANTINLTTDTAGNYVASIGTVTGLTLGGTNGVEGAIPTLAVNYGSLASTAVQGNTGITVAAGTNLSGGGAITLGAGGTVTLNTIPNPTFATSVTTPLLTSTGDLTLDSGTNKIIIAGTDTAMERTAAGSYTIDLKDNAATSLVLSNSSPGGSSFANLNLADGELQIAGIAVIGNDRSLQNITGITNIGTLTTSGGLISLNNASNFDTNINTGTSTGTITLGGGTAPLVINSTNFDVSSAGAISGITTINASGLATISGGATISGAVINLNASSNFAVNIGTGTSNGTVTIGGGSAPLAINSTAFDVSSAGALSGITTISMSGAITAATASNTINGLIINAGALSGVTGITFSSGNLITSQNNNNLTLDAQGTGSLVLTGYNCSTQSNGGALTTNASGVVACSADDSGISDSRLKENITDLNSDILNRIKDVRTVTFDFDCNQQYFQGQILDCRTDRQTGIIAQELEAIFPELVYEGEDGYKRVNFKALNFYNLKAVSELAAILSSNGDARLNNVSTDSTLRLSSTGVLQNITGLNIISGGATVNGNIGVTNGLYRINGVNGASVSCANNNLRGTFTGGIATSLSCAGLSDARLKENVVSLDASVLDKIGGINTISFDFKCSDTQYSELHLDCGRQTGVLAQELATIFPELVYQGEDGYYRVKYDALNVYTLKAVGELAKERKTQKVTADTTAGVQTGGTMRLDGNGALQNITGLQMVSGGASIVGGIDNKDGGMKNVGSVLGATTINAQSITLDSKDTSNLMTLTKDGNGVFSIFNDGAVELKLSSDVAFVVKNGAAKDYFSINTNGALVTIGSTQADDKAVLLVLDTKASAGDPEGINGAQYYNSASGKFRCYQNDHWQDCLPVANPEYVLVSPQVKWKQEAGDQELPDSPRSWVDLSNVRQLRLTLRLTEVGSEEAACRLQYAQNDDGPWNDLAASATGRLQINKTGSLKTDWVSVADDARKEVLVRVVCSGGNYDESTSIGAQPALGAIKLQLR